MRRSDRFHERRRGDRKPPRRPDAGTLPASSGSRERSRDVGPYNPELRELLAGIGAPKPAPFQPDPFQLEALAALESEDVLVTAPTGSGKTWVAREEIRRLLNAGKRAWYTTPLKVLANRSSPTLSFLMKRIIWPMRTADMFGKKQSSLLRHVYACCFFRRPLET